MGEVWGRFWLSESLKSFNASVSRVFAVALFAMLQDFDKLFRCSTVVRASLSTWRNNYKGLVSVGAGLPTQQSNRGSRFRFLFVVQDVFAELCSFSWGHRSEEGLHPSYF